MSGLPRKRVVVFNWWREGVVVGGEAGVWCVGNVRRDRVRVAGSEGTFHLNWSSGQQWICNMGSG